MAVGVFVWLRTLIYLFLFYRTLTNRCLKLNAGYFSTSSTNCMHASPPQVKIWFQNKRSKFKKLLKQGGNPHESDPMPGSMSLSPRSPTIPPIWDVSASSKGVNMPANSYMPGYSHWYSSPHQDSMQR